MHHRYDEDEQRLRETASEELWTSDLLDMTVDVSAPILRAAQWQKVPEYAPQLWHERSVAILALGAIGLRQARAIAVTVRSGWSPEAHGPYRRLQEAAGHAQGVARDSSGQYAENWIRGKGRAASPQIAFGGGSGGDPLWGLMSNQAHANFEHYINLSRAWDDEKGFLHRLIPERDLKWDNIFLWMTGRRLMQIFAASLTVHEHIDQTDFLAVGRHVEDGEIRLANELDQALEHSS